MSTQAPDQTIATIFSGEDMVGNVVTSKDSNKILFGYDAESTSPQYTVYTFDSLDHVANYLFIHYRNIRGLWF